MIDGEETTEKQPSRRKNGGLVRKSGNQNINYWSGFHVFTVLCCCGLAMSILTLIPRHNSIHDQSYWFEISTVTAISYLITTAVIVLDFVVLFQNTSVVTIRFFLKNYFATFLTWLICFCTSYIIWTVILEYNHPMPLIGLFLWLTSDVAARVFF